MKKVVVLACILSLLVTAIVLVGCGGGSSSSQTPEQVAKAFFAAMQKIDVNTTWNLMSASTQKAIGTKTAWEASSKDSTGTMKFTVGKVTVNGNKATAKVTGTVAGKTSTQTVPLVKENGVWKVDLAAALNQ